MINALCVCRFSWCSLLESQLLTTTTITHVCVCVYSNFFPSLSSSFYCYSINCACQIDNLRVYILQGFPSTSFPLAFHPPPLPHIFNNYLVFFFLILIEKQQQQNVDEFLMENCIQRNWKKEKNKKGNGK